MNESMKSKESKAPAEAGTYEEATEWWGHIRRRNSTDAPVDDHAKDYAGDYSENHQNEESKD